MQTGLSISWDQFTVNREKFGVETSFDENLYTIPMSSLQMNEQEWKEVVDAAKEMEELILAKKQEGDSVGGIVETIAVGMPAGLGEPVFERLDGDLARILMNIGAVKGVEIGLGFDVANFTGSQINDEYQIIDGKVTTKTNNSGGIVGGMSNGMPIVSRIAVKPTPSISKCQDSIDLGKMENKKIEIKGRHDPCICPRVTVVAESSTAIVLADHMIRSGFIHPTNLEKNI